MSIETVGVCFSSADRIQLKFPGQNCRFCTCILHADDENEHRFTTQERSNTVNRGGSEAQLISDNKNTLSVMKGLFIALLIIPQLIQLPD